MKISNYSKLLKKGMKKMRKRRKIWKRKSKVGENRAMRREMIRKL